jgi:hypothetical protein
MSSFPAKHIVHWPGKDVPACDVHQFKLLSLGAFMGFPVSSSPLDSCLSVVCQNCINEEAKRTQ